jgi:hypothetical protein
MLYAVVAPGSVVANACVKVNSVEAWFEEGG